MQLSLPCAVSDIRVSFPLGVITAVNRFGNLGYLLQRKKYLSFSSSTFNETQ